MRHSALVLAFAIIVVVPLTAQNAAAPKTVGGCPAQPAAFHTCALEKAKTFNPPRTTSGKPDLQGYWRGALTQSFSMGRGVGSEPQGHRGIIPWGNAPPASVDPPGGKDPHHPSAGPA